MAWFVDTGIWLRLFDQSDPRQGSIRTSMIVLRQRGTAAAFNAQVVAEFWNVCTRPASARGGYGLPHEDVERRVRFIERWGLFLPENAADYLDWKRIVASQRVTGVAVHDARIVAAMNTAGISNILTLNVADFRRYTHLQAWSPEDVVADTTKS